MNRAALLVLPCVLLTAPAFAQPPPPPSSGRLCGVDDEQVPGRPAPREKIVMRLAYSGAHGCPAEDVVSATIGAEVRVWDPFAPNAPWHLSVTIVRRDGGYDGAA